MRFRSEAFAEFARQLAFAPRRRRRSHLDRAEQLYWDVSERREYPLDFVVFRITRYRPDTFKLVTIPGDELRHDLLALVDQLSYSLEETLDDYDPPPFTLEGLREKLNVTAKTIQRYRRQGLFARRLLDARGRRRLAFPAASVERFLAARDRQAVHRAGRFTRIDEPTRHTIITRARRLAGRRSKLTPYQVARHLGPRVGRSIEAVRQVLVRHDRRDPRTAIFARHVPRLTQKQERVIHRAYHRGIGVTALAERFGKSRYTIYRAIHRRRVAAIRTLPLDYVASPTFDLPDAEQIILESALPSPATAPPASPVASGSGAAGRADAAAPAATASTTDIGQIYGDEPHSAELERALFVRYNYLKYRAAKLRDRLNHHAPRSGDLDQIETWLRRAVAVKVRLVRGNLRLVVSIARKHLGGAGRPSRKGPTLSGLVAQGNGVLLECIETYDASRGNRFSSYLAWTLMRRFASAAPPRRHAAAAPADVRLFDRAAGEYWPLALHPARAALVDSQHMAYELAQLLEPLTERERFVVTRHFGVSDDGEAYHLEPQSLATVARSLGLTIERVRQIERRAVAKVRRAAAELHLAHPLIG